MDDYRAFIFHVNREDLLAKALRSAAEIGDYLTVVDNSRDGLSMAVARHYRPPVPLSFSQSMNFAMTSAKGHGSSFVLLMHSDAEAHSGSCMQLVEYARRLNTEGRKWGVLFTNYDALAALNLALLDDVGLWDTNLPQYFSDNDYYRRIALAGYEKIETGIPVDHTPSTTINSDPELKFLNGVTFPLYEQYYTQKWGGKPGKEIFKIPFNRR